MPFTAALAPVPTVEYIAQSDTLRIIDQRYLPHRLTLCDIHNSADIITAISEMWLRGAPLIGIAGAFGAYFAIEETRTAITLAHPDESEAARQTQFETAWAARLAQIVATRPTAVNLSWAIQRAHEAAQQKEQEAHNFAAKRSFDEYIQAQKRTVLDTATDILAQDSEICHSIGTHGLALLRAIAATKPKGEPVNILTHCNAGRLACADYGTATAPIYLAHREGIAVHVFVDETRPRNQGASLTAWELGQAGVAHTLIPDNTGGLLMQQGKVDICIVGTDRVTNNGDVANKIGTYLKALAAHDNHVPFWVALPLSTFDASLKSGNDIEIEERSEDEVLYMTGTTHTGSLETVRIAPEGTKALNYGFDITPARLVTGFITERGVYTMPQHTVSLETVKEIFG